MRHAIHRGASLPILAAFGATRDSSYVDVGERVVTVRFGLSHHRIDRADIAGASRSQWTLLGGIGWRVGRGTLALIGSLHGIVHLQLARPYTHHVLLLPMRFDNLYLSMEEPDALLRDLGF